MDHRTIRAYNGASAEYAAEWLAQPSPTDMYSLLDRYFSPGLTVDIGCGVGRDVAWLAAKGFDVVGYDASEGLLRQARQAYPELRFEHAALPALAGVPSKLCQNVLCETVLMHLDPIEVAPSARRIVDLLRPSGTVYLS